MIRKRFLDDFEDIGYLISLAKGLVVMDKLDGQTTMTAQVIATEGPEPGTAYVRYSLYVLGKDGRRKERFRKLIFLENAHDGIILPKSRPVIEPTELEATTNRSVYGKLEAYLSGAGEDQKAKALFDAYRLN
ncbi:hypothetical protein GOV09_05105 [Candidatus Woesearchaeota archaeon]|nr:hypothetical protein [Candidatus Woesearchaeota archaeon]